MPLSKMYVAAVAAECDCIVTHNLLDFTLSNIFVISPESAIAQIEN